MYKKRKGFREIGILNRKFCYTLSWTKDHPYGLLIVYDDSDTRHVIDLEKTNIPQRPDSPPTWRGKWGDKSYGKYEVAYLIQQNIISN